MAQPTATKRGNTGLLVDLGWSALVVAMTVRAVANEDADIVQVVAGLVALAAVPARRRWPIPTLVVGLGAALVTMTAAEQPTPVLPVVVLLIYHVARYTDRTSAIWAGLAGVSVLTANVVIIVGTDHLIGAELFAAFAWPTLAAAAGDGERSRAEVVAAAVERAERAEHTRDEVVRRQVVEERLRIARDLHDVVAHNIAIVNVQTNVAEHLLRTDPDAAHTALGHVRTSAQLVLDELADILGVLRSDNDAASPTDPTPTLDEVPALIDHAANAGLHVVLQTSGAPRPLQRTASIAAYRVLQEALTNAQKHGDGHAEVDIDFASSHLHIMVRNRARDDHDDAQGYGLIGMNERVTAAGGMLTAGQRPAGEFVVDATFPIGQSAAHHDEQPVLGDAT